MYFFKILEENILVTTNCSLCINIWEDWPYYKSTGAKNMHLYRLWWHTILNQPTLQFYKQRKERQVKDNYKPLKRTNQGLAHEGNLEE